MDRQIVGHAQGPINPNRLRWNAFDIPAEPTDFIDGLICLASSSAADQAEGVSVYVYAANTSMQRAFFNADGEWLIVPQQGRLRIVTELGVLDIEPLEIAVLPRGLKFSVQLLDDSARGYLCENHGCALRLPELGPIGSNGLANPRDFLSPVACFEERDEPLPLVQKFLGELWVTQLEHSPFDVVGWHGNNVPYKYDLRRFNTLGTVSYDHPDPSIFTVLTSPGVVHGQANIDFVIFPPRWMVAENTFRPPWFHRNLMNEFMGLIDGAYDAKAEGFRRLVVAPLHERPWAGQCHGRKSHRGRPETAQDRKYHGLHVRNRQSAAPQPPRAGLPAIADRLRCLLERHGQDVQ